MTQAEVIEAIKVLTDFVRVNQGHNQTSDAYAQTANEKIIELMKLL